MFFVRFFPGEEKANYFKFMFYVYLEIEHHFSGRFYFLLKYGRRDSFTVKLSLFIFALDFIQSDP